MKLKYFYHVKGVASISSSTIGGDRSSSSIANVYTNVPSIYAHKIANVVHIYARICLCMSHRLDVKDHIGYVNDDEDLNVTIESLIQAKRCF